MTSSRGQQIEYGKSGTHLTRSLVALTDVGQNTSISRINAKLAAFCVECRIHREAPWAAHHFGAGSLENDDDRCLITAWVDGFASPSPSPQHRHLQRQVCSAFSWQVW